MYLPGAKMDKNYQQSIQDHVKSCTANLDELHNIAKERSLSLFEYLAAERLLQTLVEATIGYSKQLAKSLTNELPKNAYDAFFALHHKDLLTTEELEMVKKVIGLRNTLVHDYLNIQPDVISEFFA